MRISAAFRAMVADRVGLLFPFPPKQIPLANRPALTTVARRVPKALANLFRPLSYTPALCHPSGMELANRAERIRRRAWLSRDVRTWQRLMALAGEAHLVRDLGTAS